MDIARLQPAWPELSALLDEALALAEAERGPWLASLPPERAVHRKALAELLGQSGRAGAQGFEALPRFAGLANDLLVDADDPLGASAAGDLVGPYRLIEELGRGGMGTVWLAERADQQPRRRVALKLPHIGWEPNLNARLARERDILASLEHPHIARLYDAGVDQLGRPYLALEYVAGMPIDRYGETHRLSVRQRLGLLLQVARAVAHAHTRLVVHRDLKPSNVLVAEGGEVRLLDFGIAKLLQTEGGGEASELTRIGGGGLTPDYASPEQIRGEAIGTASDVYSLGVVAYELLAGTRPYRLKSVSGTESLVDRIAKVEVPLASSAGADVARARQLNGDLDAILNKALKKDPAERYPSVDAFAADIERHLRGEPVAARPDSAWYRLDRWLRRHKLETAVGVAIVIAVPAGAAAQAAVLTAIGAGAAVALWQARSARAQAALAEAQATRAEQVKQFMLSIFADADTDSGAGAATTASDLLKAAALRVDREFADRPEIAVELMTAVGYGLIGQARLDDADELLAKAVRRGRDELGDRHPLTLAAVVVHGEAITGLSRPREAIALLQPVVAEARRQGALLSLINGLSCLAAAQSDVGDVDAAIESAQASVNALPPNPGPTLRLAAVDAWGMLAHTLHADQRPGQVDAARHALALAKDIHGERMTEQVLSARLYLAKGLVTEGQDARAHEELSAILADAVRLLGPAHPRVEVAANFIGQARLDAGDAAGAIDAFRLQLETSEKMQRSSPRNVGMGHFAVATALAAAHRFEEALPHYETSARLTREAEGPDAPLASRSLSSRALALARLGRLDQAEQGFAELAQVTWAGMEEATQAGRLAGLRSLQGRHDEAVALARAAVEGARSHPSKRVRADMSKALGLALLAGACPGEAIAPLDDAVRLYAEKQLVMSPERAEAIAALARARVDAAPGDLANPRPA